MTELSDDEKVLNEKNWIKEWRALNANDDNWTFKVSHCIKKLKASRTRLLNCRNIDEKNKL